MALLEEDFAEELLDLAELEEDFSLLLDFAELEEDFSLELDGGTTLELDGTMLELEATMLELDSSTLEEDATLDEDSTLELDGRDSTRSYFATKLALVESYPTTLMV